MKFRIINISENEMSVLSKLGFEFEKRIVFEKEKTFIQDKVNNKHVEIEIKNLEDLLNFIKKFPYSSMVPLVVKKYFNLGNW